MKYSDYFLSPATRWIATCAGLLSGSLTWMFTRWEYGVIGGVTVAVLVTLILPFVMVLQNLPIERLKAKVRFSLTSRCCSARRRARSADISF